MGDFSHNGNVHLIDLTMVDPELRNNKTEFYWVVDGHIQRKANALPTPLESIFDKPSFWRVNL